MLCHQEDFLSEATGAVSAESPGVTKLMVLSQACRVLAFIVCQVEGAASVGAVLAGCWAQVFRGRWWWIGLPKLELATRRRGLPAAGVVAAGASLTVVSELEENSGQCQFGIDGQASQDSSSTGVTVPGEGVSVGAGVKAVGAAGAASCPMPNFHQGAFVS